jgi:hypothetical protein
MRRAGAGFPHSDAIILATMTFAEAMQILAALERHDVAYVLVGSMAMAAQGIVSTLMAYPSASPRRACCIA